MIPVRLKPGVSLDKVHPRMFLVPAFAAPIWERYGAPELWITGGNEGGHTTNPDPRRRFHRLPDGLCQAEDLRTWNIPEREHRLMACRELANILGPDYDVLFEDEIRDPISGTLVRGEHCHVQFDPGRPGTRV